MIAEQENARKPSPELSTRRCENPGCSSRLEWSGGRGRPPLFCSDACRQRLAKSARHLRRLFSDCETELGQDGLSYRERRRLSAELARLQWLLSDYPTAD